MFALADKVMHCTVAELSHRLSTTEYFEWGIYLDYKAQKEEEAMEKAKRKSGRGRAKSAPHTKKRR